MVTVLHVRHHVHVEVDLHHEVEEQVDEVLKDKQRQKEGDVVDRRRDGDRPLLNQSVLIVENPQQNQVERLKMLKA